jgi:uncharacterized protein YlxW (UPF0749 family)
MVLNLLQERPIRKTRSTGILRTPEQGSQFSIFRPARCYRQTMARTLIGGVIVALIAALLFFLYAGSYRTRIQAQEQQISQLNDQLIKLQTENEQLKTQLGKVQAEQATLAAQNEEMQRAIATYKATGKMPPTPPPAK